VDHTPCCRSSGRKEQVPKEQSNVRLSCVLVESVQREPRIQLNETGYSGRQY